MSAIHDRHLELVDNVNNSATETEYRYCEAVLSGFRDGVRTCGHKLDLIACDFHTMDKYGAHREMVCGVLLDWQPADRRDA